MMSSEAKYRVGFKTRVLLPVAGIILLLFAVTLWVVNVRLTRVIRGQAASNLDAVASVFENFQDLRGQDLLLRARTIQSDPRFKVVAQGGDAREMGVLLRDLAEELDLAAAAFYGDDGRLLAFGGLGEAVTNDAVQEILVDADGGKFPLEMEVLDNRLIELAALPVQAGADRSGYVVIGQEIGARSANEFKMLTGCEEVLFRGHRIVVSTVARPDDRREIEAVLARTELPDEIVLGGQTFLLRSGTLGRDSESGCKYLLLSSLEQATAELQAAQWMLVMIGAWGVLGCVVVVRFILARAAAPLELLTDGAERIGRGDFSKRIAIGGRDEFAVLGRAFNDMADNLQGSRSSLEASLATLKETRDRLSQTEKLSAIGEFIAGVAHELNNPLTVMIGFANLLQEADLPPDRKAEVRQIADAAERCQKVVQGLLSFARQRPPERKAVNLNEVLEGTARFLQYECRTSNVELLREYDSRLPDVMGDAHQLQQVFLNLINNARQAVEETGKAGQIRLHTSSVGATVRVVIEDDGPGIPPAALGRIFDPFFTTKAVGKGTGLGLSVSYGIVREHGGDIHAESQPGRGATFVVDLPATQSRQSTPETGTGATPSGSESRTGTLKRVLIIDDEPSLLLLGQRMLAMGGYSSETAQNGEAGVAAASHRHFDAVLCDWKMPGIGGRDIFERIQHVRPELAGRFIIMSGDVLNPSLTDYARSHGIVLLPKPFNLTELRDALTRSLAASPSST